MGGLEYLKTSVVIIAGPAVFTDICPGEKLMGLNLSKIQLSFHSYFSNIHHNFFEKF